MKKSLIIGSTSQLSRYFPSNFDRISSREINFDKIKEKRYDKIYLLFAEQRTYLKEQDELFDEINVRLTTKVLDELVNYCDKLIVYSTSELWNNYEGPVSLSLDFNYNFSPYIRSKEKLCTYIKSNKERYKNVIIIYPFNFNSAWRKEGFLFSKIFDSIINKKRITIGDVNFRRDLIHPKIIADISIIAEEDTIIGSGELINIDQFIKDLYTRLDMSFEDYVSTDKSNNLNNKRSEYYNSIALSNYQELIKLTVEDIYEYKISQRYD